VEKKQKCTEEKGERGEERRGGKKSRNRPPSIHGSDHSIVHVCAIYSFKTFTVVYN